MNRKSVDSALKQKTTEEIKSHICDSICRFANDCRLTQDALDEHCENCIVDKIAKIESEVENE